MRDEANNSLLGSGDFGGTSKPLKNIKSTRILVIHMKNEDYQIICILFSGNRKMTDTHNIWKKNINAINT